MKDAAADETFRKLHATKIRNSDHFDHGYPHSLGEKFRRTNFTINEFISTFRQKQATEWHPQYVSEHPKPFEITCYAIHHSHVGHLPNYGGYIPGRKFRFGRTFGWDTMDAKRWLRGDHRPN